MQLDRLREFVATTRADQGLPPVVEDVTTLAHVASILRCADVPDRRAAA
jgi:hypothetical protein